MSETSARPRRRAPRPRPDPSVQALLEDNVNIIPDYGWSPIELARYGMGKPLADRLRQGAKQLKLGRLHGREVAQLAKEILAAANWIEGKTKTKSKTKAHEAFMPKAAATCVFALENMRWSREAAINAVGANLGRSRGYIYAAVKKYENDPKCKAGKLFTPWPDLELFGSVLNYHPQRRTSEQTT